jgi:hypothetical protein
LRRYCGLDRNARIAPLPTAVAYVYFASEPGRRAAANLITKDEARRIAAGIAKLPEPLPAKG